MHARPVPSRSAGWVSPNLDGSSLIDSAPGFGSGPLFPEVP